MERRAARSLAAQVARANRRRSHRAAEPALRSQRPPLAVRQRGLRERGGLRRVRRLGRRVRLVRGEGRGVSD